MNVSGGHEMSRFWRQLFVGCAGISLFAAATISAPITSGLAGASSPSGKAIVIGGIYPGVSSAGSDPDTGYGMDAAAKYINAKLKGIDGRPLKVDLCPDHQDATQTTACARRFVSEGAVAVTGISSSWASVGIPLVEQAKIPSLTQPIGGAEFSSAVSFPLPGGGLLGEIPAMVYYLAHIKKVKSVATISDPLPVATGAFTTLFNAPLNKLGVTTTLVTASETAADYSPTIEKATQGNPSAVMIGLAVGGCAQILKQAAQLGVKTQWSGLDSCVSPTVLKQAKAGANGLIAPGLNYAVTDTSQPDVKTYLTEFAKYEKGILPGEQSLAGFSQIMTLYAMSRQLTGVMTSASLLNLLEAGAPVQIFAGPTFSKSNAPAGYPHLYNPAVRVFQVKNGKFVDVGKGWVNGFNNSISQK